MKINNTTEAIKGRKVFLNSFNKLNLKKRSQLTKIVIFLKDVNFHKIIT